MWQINIIYIILLIEFVFLFYHKLKIIKKYNKEKWIKILKIKNKIKKFIMAYGGCFLIIIISLIGFVILLKYTYNENTDLVNSYCSFLSFVGTVMIGYYIYKKERDIDERNKLYRYLRLRNTVATSYGSLITFGSVKMENTKIIYDKNWYQYMTEYIECSNSNKIIDIHIALSSFFNCIDCINEELQKGNYDRAINIKNVYMEKQKYLPINYNVVDLINDIEKFNIISNLGEYDESDSVLRKFFAVEHIKNADITEWVIKYYNIIELLIYNDIVKYGKINVYETNKKIINKLFLNESLKEEVCKKLKYYSIEVVSHIVWKVYDKISNNSNKIEIIDNCYDLK